MSEARDCGPSAQRCIRITIHKITGRKACGISFSYLHRRQPAIPTPLLLSLSVAFRFKAPIHHHGAPKDLAGSHPLHFQLVAKAQHGLHLALRAACVPHRGKDQGKLVAICVAASDSTARVAEEIQFR